MDKIRAREYRRTRICIDSFENGIPSGCFSNPYLLSEQYFYSLMELICALDSLHNKMQLPQSDSRVRTFFDSAVAEMPIEQGARSQRRGAVATFELHMLFRRHASWQGTIAWLEGGIEQPFQSELSLIMLMQQVLEGKIEPVSIGVG